MCEYCDGGKPLPLDKFSTSDDFFIVEARVVGAGEEYPAIEVNADGALIYIRTIYCPNCGRDLRGEGDGR